MQRMLWGCHYASIYQAQPDSPFFGQVPLHAGQQLANLTSGLGASRLVLSDFEAALVIQHHSGSPKAGSVIYGERARHGNGTIYHCAASYWRSGLLTENNILDWAALADKAYLKELAKLCSEFLYFNGSKLQHQCTGLGPLVLQSLPSFCHGDFKASSSYDLKASADIKARANKFMPVPESFRRFL